MAFGAVSGSTTELDQIGLLIGLQPVPGHTRPPLRVRRSTRTCHACSSGCRDEIVMLLKQLRCPVVVGQLLRTSPESRTQQTLTQLRRVSVGEPKARWRKQFNVSSR